MALTYKLEPMPTVTIPECAGDCPLFHSLDPSGYGLRGHCDNRLGSGEMCHEDWDVCEWFTEDLKAGLRDPDTGEAL